MKSRPADRAAGAWREALGLIASLIGKSGKARQKLEPGTWQHTMLGDNLKALRMAVELGGGEPGAAVRFAPDELQDALRAMASMMRRTREAQARFSPGTSQRTLLRNRLKALRAAEALIRAARNP